MSRAVAGQRGGVHASVRALCHPDLQLHILPHRQPDEAEDLTSRVFHRALNHINHYDNRGVPFSAWLYRIAHNLVANWHRDNSRRKEVPLEDHTACRTARAPEARVVNNQELEDLLKVIRRLPAERQQLLILKFVEGMSNAEIAVIMMRSEGAIKSLYHRTLLALRDEMVKHESGFIRRS